MWMRCEVYVWRENESVNRWSNNKLLIPYRGVMRREARRWPDRLPCCEGWYTSISEAEELDEDLGENIFRILHCPTIFGESELELEEDELEDDEDLDLEDRRILGSGPLL